MAEADHDGAGSGPASANPYAALLGAGGSTEPYPGDDDFTIKKGAVTKLGADVAAQAAPLAASGDAIKRIPLSDLSFGLVGYPLNAAHVQAKDTATNALQGCKDVLDSWQTALEGVVSYVTMKEQESTLRRGGGGGTDLDDLLAGLGGKHGPGADLGGLDLGDTGLGKTGLGSTGLGDIGAGDLGDLGDLGSTGNGDVGGDTGGTAPDLPSIDQPTIDDPTVDDPTAGLPSLDQPTLTDPGTTDPSTTTPTLGGNNGTGLAGYDPTTTPVPRPTLGDPAAGGNSSYDPRAVPPEVRTGTGTPYSMGSGGAAGPGAGTAAGRATGSGGMPFMPFAPMGGTGHEGDKGRERGASVNEDESTWQGDEDIAPPVIGLEEG
jgi:hypothetical protein